MSKPLISAIVVSYNEAEYLQFAIDSILEQDYENIEIIIGDDGSSDGSIEIIEEYHSKYPQKIKFFVMPRDEEICNIIPSIRVSNVMKRAFEIASGDYLCALSGDDYFTDNQHFSKDIKCLEENKDILSVAGGYAKVYPDGTEERILDKTPFPWFWGGKYLHVSCYTFRKVVLDNILDRFCDDTGLIYSILCAGDVMYTNEVSFAYRQRDKSIMHEARMTELYLLEMLLFQDCINHGKYKFFSYARIYKPYRYLYKNRSCISNYGKYIEASNKYANDFIKDLVVSETDKKRDLKVKTSITLFGFCWFIVHVYYKLNK